MMLAEWRYLRPISKLYTTVFMCFYSRYIADFITFFKSLSDSYSTR